MSEDAVAVMLAELAELRAFVAGQVEALSREMARLQARVEQLEIRAVSALFVPDPRLLDNN
jgi:ubiquinone biosynthesis protein UbiJ